MKNITLSSFIKSSNIDAPLIRAVVRNISGWASFTERANDIQNHGAAGGFGNFIYYSDTVKFTTNNKQAIFKLIREQSESFGESGSIVDFIKNFNCLKNYKIAEIEDGLYNPRSDDKTYIFNTLAWYALEEVARAYCDFMEEY